MIDDKDFGFLIEQLNQIVRETEIRVGLVNTSILERFNQLEEAINPVGVNGFELMIYDKLKDEHVLFFSSKEDAQEFIDACEECIQASPEADPEALVGVVIEYSKQRLIKKNTITDKGIQNDGRVRPT